MRTRDAQLIYFVLDLANSYIDQYQQLATMTRPSDADLSPSLMATIVDELFELAEQLINASKEEKLTNEMGQSAAAQIRFYLEQEDLRVTAAELMYGHRLEHSPYQLTQKKLRQLSRVATQGGLVPTGFLATTQTQIQCEHGSHQIAARILENFHILSRDAEAKQTGLFGGERVAQPQGYLANEARLAMVYSAKSGHYKKEAVKREILRGESHCKKTLASLHSEKSETKLADLKKRVEGHKLKHVELRDRVWFSAPYTSPAEVEEEKDLSTLIPRFNYLESNDSSLQMRDRQLLTFLFQLIDIQIKKYVDLARIGVGPEAPLSAWLAAKVVDDNLKTVQDLLEMTWLHPLDDEIYGKTLAKIQYYLEQEHLRITAADLLDSNPVHNRGYGRVDQMLKDIRRIAATVHPRPAPYVTRTEEEKQFEHDSYSIAQFLLAGALTAKDNPDAPLLQFPAHPRDKIKENARKGRYGQREILKELLRGRDHCAAFLSKSSIQKSKVGLDRADADRGSEVHAAHMKELLAVFHTRVPAEEIMNMTWFTASSKQTQDVVISSQAPRFQFIEENRASTKCKAVLFKVVTGTVLTGLATAAVATVVARMG